MSATKKNFRHQGFETDQDFFNYHEVIAANPDHPQHYKSVQVLETHSRLDQAALTRKAVGRPGKWESP